MPYLITTSEPFDAAEHAHRPAFSRRAVATLDEAREAVHGQTHAPQLSADECKARITERGGTVGPLPDGTVIEAKLVDWRSFIDPVIGTENEQSGLYKTIREQAIDAYNAAQSEPEVHAFHTRSLSDNDLPPRVDG